MTAPRRPQGARARSRRRRAAPVAAWVVRAVVVGLAFAVGVAVGQALAEDPASGRDRTHVRTVRPGTLPPAPETVTVTVTR